MSAKMTVKKLTKRKEELNSSFLTPTKAPAIAYTKIQSYIAPTRCCVTHAIPTILNTLKCNRYTSNPYYITVFLHLMYNI